MLCFIFAPVIAADPPQNHITIMSWNVENLFDTLDDRNTKDEEFTPTGARHWTKRHLGQKLDNLAKIITNINYGHGPEILAMMEIENLFVLNKLSHHPRLATPYPHKYLRNSQDIRGIDVAMASRYRARVKWHSVYYGGRDILEARISVRGASLYLLINHWRSRRGGRKKTSHRRILAAKKCRQIVSSILAKNSDADIVVLGDFNDNPDNPSISYFLGAVPYQAKTGTAFLYNLITDADMSDPDVRYPHYFDQIIVSRGLLDQQGFSYVPNSFQILAYPALRDDAGYPRRFFQKTGEGYSDHFPIVAQFQIHEKGEGIGRR